MEYRVLYRDLPWSVALGVLPGKVIGTFIIKPYKYIKRNLRRVIIRTLIVLLIIIIPVFIFIIVQNETDGAFLNWLTHLKDACLSWFISDSAETAEELATAVKESGL